MEGTDRVRDFINQNGLEIGVKVFADASTHTSESAAKALRCTPAQIAKTIAFTADYGSIKKPVLVVLSGDKLVDIEKLKSATGSNDIKKMNASEVEALTGYVIGGVPPFPHDKDVEVVIDKSLFRFELVWAAAGDKNAVMPIDPKLLVEKLGLREVAVSK